MQHIKHFFALPVLFWMATLGTLKSQSIYEIYNSSGGTWPSDYIILSGFSANQSVVGKSVQYRGSTSTNWINISLTGTADASGFYRIWLDASSMGAPWTPQLSDPSFAMTHTGSVGQCFQVALMNTTNTTSGTGTCPSSNIIDIVSVRGINSGTANGSPACCGAGNSESPSTTTQSHRRAGDTGDDETDFVLIDNPYVSSCPTFSGAPPNVTITSNSTCGTGCALSGGVITAPSGTPCPTGSTLQYQVNNDPWSTSPPNYNQSAAQTIRTRCSCDSDANTNSTESSAVITAPGTCTVPNAGTITGTTTICANTTSQLAISGGASGGTWSSSNTMSASVNASGLVSGNAGGVSVISYTVTSGGCTSTSTAAFTVNARPNAAIAITENNVFYDSFTGLAYYNVSLTDGILCTGPLVPSPSTNATLTASGGGTYQWSTNGNNPITVSNAGTYTVTVTNAATCTSTASRTISVNSAPDPGMVSAVPSIGTYFALGVCENASITLSSTVPGGVWDAYNKSPNVVSTDPMTGFTMPLISTPAVDSHSVFYRVALNGCINSVRTTVIVLDVNQSPPSTPLAVCLGANVQITSTVGQNGSWMSSNMGVATVSNTGVVTGMGPGTTNITASNGCNTNSIIAVTVNAPPTAPTSASSDVNNFCNNTGGDLTLTAIGGSGTTLKWFTGSCGGTEVGMGTSLTIAKPTTTTTYYARWESEGCATPSSCASVVITVNTPPTAPNSAESDANNFCANVGGSLNLSAAGGSGGTLNWYSGSCGGTSIGTGTPLNIPKPTATTTYYARWETTGCAASACASTAVTVNQLPTCAVTGANSVCASSTGNIYSGTAGMSSYSWSVSGNGASVGSTTGSAVTVTANTSGTFTVAVTITDANGCSSSCSKTVTINIPSCTVSGPTLACANATGYVYTASGGLTNHVWSVSGSGSIAGSNTGSSVTVTAGSSGTYTVSLTATDANGCTAICSLSAGIAPNPSCFLTGPTSVCPNSTGDVVSAPEGMSSYNWGLSGAGSFASSPAGPAVTVNAGASGSYTVSVTITNGSGCTSTCYNLVLVGDTQPPSIACPSNVVRSADPSSCGASVTYPLPVATDNCPGVGLDHLGGGLSGSFFNVGTTSVTWMATDAQNLTAVCSFTITIVDAQQPTITCPANLVRNTAPGACSAVVTYATPTASDNCTLPTGQPTWVSGGTGHATGSPNSSATFPKGTTIVQWKATDGAGSAKTCTFRIIVNDTESPTMTCPSPINANTGSGACSTVVTYTNPPFTDNCPPTSGTSVRTSGLPSGSAFPAGTSTVIFRATDAAGKTSTCSLQVTVTDTQLPNISCPGNVNVVGSGTPCQATAFYASATASDNCDGPLTPFLVTGLGSGSNFPAGTTTNIWRAIANNGQSSDCSFTVTVSCPSAKPAGANSLHNALETRPHASKAALSLVPNPAVSELTIAVGGLGAQGGSLSMFDALGRAVWQHALGAEQTQTTLQGLESWPKGVYMVVLHTDGQVVTRKVVLQ